MFDAKLVAVLAFTVAMVNSIFVEDNFIQEWSYFKDRFGKIYNNATEEENRFQIFIGNKLKIEDHNELYLAGNSTYALGVNQFADMSDEEYKRMFLLSEPYVVTDNETNDNFLQLIQIYNGEENVTLPDFIDWRTKGAVTPVKNQGTKCGSCWAFAAVGSIEGQYFRETGQLIELSVQNLLDCSVLPPNKGCEGGNALRAYQYVLQNGGISTAESYPYEAVQGPCRFNGGNIGATIKGLNFIRPDDEEVLKSAVALKGPISVLLDVISDSFRFYKSGILNDPECGTNEVNHNMLAVGYGTDSNGQDYWIIKNSFGTEWGDNGYIKVARNKNSTCSIGQISDFPDP